MLRGFEIATGLRVNFHKSKVLGFNLDHEFLQQAYAFLSYGINDFPFSFLGIPIGVNSRRHSLWEHVLAKVRQRLSTCKGNNLSLGGRVILLNSVLNSIPLFIFSFYKAPKLVIQDMIKIKRTFLWCGEENNKRIN